MNSLRGRLTLAVVAALLCGGLVAGVGLYLQAIDETNEQFDIELLAVSSNVSAETLSHPQSIPVDGDPENDDLVVQLWGLDGRLAYHSDAEQAPAPHAIRIPEVLPTASDRWFSYSRRLQDGRLLQVAQPESARREMAAESALRLLIPLLVVLPFLAAFVAWMIARQLRPLNQLALRLAHRAPDDDSPVVVANAPREMLPTVAALNELLMRQAAAADQQRAFLAEAAHELRTPVAVVKLQAQLARKSSGSSAREAAFATLETGIDRLTHLVTQLLALARSEAQAAAANHKQILQLDMKLKEWLAVLYPLSQAKGLDLGLTRADDCKVLGDPDGLESLVANLLQNAIAYTPTGGQINVALVRAAGCAELTVADSGPGVAPAHREQMFQRFVRGAHGSATGSGLGLAIARQQAARHAGTIELLDNASGTGLMVRVRLPVIDEPNHESQARSIDRTCDPATAAQRSVHSGRAADTS